MPVEAGRARGQVRLRNGSLRAYLCLDFDGSFWRAVDPDGGKEPPPFFINYDKGYITLISEDEARYEASTGEEVVLRRIEGPVVIGGCGQPTMGEPTLTPIPTTATD
jgi:hypothetical protein